MQKIIPHLWYDKEAVEAATFYTDIFGNSTISSVKTIKDTPSGDTEIVSFELEGYKFMAISAGPLFKFNPSISFHVRCETNGEVDKIWERLSGGAKVLMELGSYPFSNRYGWLEDKYGLSWQVIHSKADSPQKIMPALMFTKEKSGRAEEAINFYSSVFHNSKVGDIQRWVKGQEPEKEGSVMYCQFTLEGQEFAAMDSANEHDFSFNEAISLIVSCRGQEEIDYYWEKLSAEPESEQCGWLKDKFGLSWQIVPTAMEKMMAEGDANQLARVTEAFLQMKKFDLGRLEKAYEGK